MSTFLLNRYQAELVADYCDLSDPGHSAAGGPYRDSDGPLTCSGCLKPIDPRETEGAAT